MTSGLESLFGQILYSEQKANERRSKINEVKSEINKCLEEYREEEEGLKKCQGQMVIKLRQHDDVKLGAEWESRKEETLREQKEKLVKENQVLKDKLKDLSAELQAKTQKFLSTAQEFCEGYDLISNGAETRQVQWREETRVLEQREKQLQNELQSLRRRQYNWEELTVQREEWKLKVDDEKNKVSDLEKQLAQKAEKLNKLREQKEEVSRVPQTDPEFKRLQRELDGCRDDTMEAVCVSLQQELQALQQSQWQRQLLARNAPGNKQTPHK